MVPCVKAPPPSKNLTQQQQQQQQQQSGHGRRRKKDDDGRRRRKQKTLDREEEKKRAQTPKTEKEEKGTMKSNPIQNNQRNDQLLYVSHAPSFPHQHRYLQPSQRIQKRLFFSFSRFSFSPLLYLLRRIRILHHRLSVFFNPVLYIHKS